MTISFPHPLVVGQTYTYGNETWSWDGIAWHVDPIANAALRTLTPASRSTLTYEVTAGMAPLSSIGLGTPDIYGNSYALSDTFPYEQVSVHVDGLLLVEDDGGGLLGDWTVDTSLNTLDFVSPLAEGQIIQVAILTPPSLYAQGSVNAREVLDIDTDWATPGHPPGEIDGIQTVFELYWLDPTATEVPISATASAEVSVFVDGVQQRPSIDYTVSGSTLTFLMAAPAADSTVWAIWYQPAATAQGVLSYASAALLLADTPAAGSIGAALDENTVWLREASSWQPISTRPFADLTTLLAWAPDDGATAIDEGTGLRYQRIAGAWAPQTIIGLANYAAITALTDVLAGQMAIDLALSDSYIWTGSVWQTL